RVGLLRAWLHFAHRTGDSAWNTMALVGEHHKGRTRSMEQRIFNFSAGPAILPLPVLQEAQRDLLCLPGAGASILEISHRSKAFKQILEAAKQNLRSLLKVPENYHILFLQGGASQQFAMIPMAFLAGQEKPASYLVAGAWGKKAIAEAKRFGTV